jgi:hypothetical protein
MRYETRTVRIGENVGPVDWSHSTAANMPEIWREAEKRPIDFLFRGRAIFAVCMYDGWPFWEPRPAVQFHGPIGPDWAFFDSYGVDASAMSARSGETSGLAPQDASAVGKAETPNPNQDPSHV